MLPVIIRVFNMHSTTLAWSQTQTLGVNEPSCTTSCARISALQGSGLIAIYRDKRTWRLRRSISSAFIFIWPGRCGSRGGGTLGARAPLNPPFWDPNFCHHRDSAARCLQNLGCPPPLHKTWVRTCQDPVLSIFPWLIISQWLCLFKCV